MSFSDQHEFRHFRARNHHATTTQNMSLEYRTILLDFGGEENVWVLRVELEGFTNVRPTQSARWEGEFNGTKREEFDERTDEKNGEE